MTTLTTANPRGTWIRCSIADQRRQHEAEQNRQCDGHEDITTKIEHRDNDDSEDRSRHRAEQRHKFFSGARLEWLPDHRPHLLSITWVAPK